MSSASSASHQVSVMGNLLAALADGGLHSTAELARRLDISLGLVAAMTDDLARRGFLAPLEVKGACGVGCGGCSIRTACGEPGSPATAPILFSLTAKGQRAIRGAKANLHR